MVRSWMMMEALIAGWMPSAKIVAMEKAPPDIMFIRPRIVLLSCCSNISDICSTLTNGTGMTFPMR